MNCIRLKLSKTARNSENPATPPGAAEDTHEPDHHQTGDLPQPLQISCCQTGQSAADSRT